MNISSISSLKLFLVVVKQLRKTASKKSALLLSFEDDSGPQSEEEAAVAKAETKVCHSAFLATSRAAVLMLQRTSTGTVVLVNRSML